MFYFNEDLREDSRGKGEIKKLKLILKKLNFFFEIKFFLKKKREKFLSKNFHQKAVFLKKKKSPPLFF